MRLGFLRALCFRDLSLCVVVCVRFLSFNGSHLRLGSRGACTLFQEDWSSASLHSSVCDHHTARSCCLRAAWQPSSKEH